MTIEEKNQEYKDINSQQTDLLNQVNELYQEARKAMGKNETSNIFDQVEAAHYSQDFTDIINRGMQLQKQDAQQQANVLSQLKKMGTTKDKYKNIRSRYDLDFQMGRDNFDNANKYAQRVGISPQDAMYDWYSAQSQSERRVYIDSLISNQTGKNIFAVLASLRKISPGTERMVLTNEIVNDLYDEGIITKNQATQLKKSKISGDQGALIPSSGSKTSTTSTGSGGLTKADLTKLKNIYATRDKAVLAPIKSTKMKVTKMTPIRLTKSPNLLKIRINHTTPKLKLKLPTIAKFKIPKTFSNVIAKSYRGGRKFV
jgi:hypothetical protein